MLIAIVAALVLGLTLAAVGLRGRRVDDHPLCRRCRFDLTGRPGSSTRCPECGADLSPPRATVVGHRRRRAAVLAAGVAVVLAAAAVGVGRARHVPWLRYAPVWYVVREAGLADPARRGPALDELLRRLADGDLAGPRLDRATAAALVAQADPSRAWDNRWGDLVERARAAGHLSDDRWHRYAAGAWPAAFQLDVRPLVHRGDPCPATLWVPKARVGSRSPLVAELADVRLRWADRPAGPPSTRPAWSNTPFVTPLAPYNMLTLTLAAADMPPGLPPGPRAVRLTAGVRVGDTDADGHLVPLSAGTLDLPGRFTLTDGPTVRVVHDPSAAAAVRRSIGIQQEADHRGVIAVSVNNSPVALAYAVLVRTPDGREVRIGQLAFGVGEGMSQFGMGGADQPTTRPAVLVLRPDPAVAAADPAATAAWDGELTFPLPAADPPRR